jgi:type IV secretion system protein VirB11
MQPAEITLNRLLAPLAAALEDPDTREVVVIRPGEFGVENSQGWRWYEDPALTYPRCLSLAILAAHRTGQHFGENSLGVSSRLPGRHRITMAGPPSTPAGTINLTIRKRATSFTPTPEWLAERGYFDFLPKGTDWVAWCRERVLAKRTFLLTGETGSSKTTFAEALIREIPLDQRIVTMESVPEWDLPHRNWVPIVYAQAGVEAHGLPTATQALELALRQRPDRILFGEMRTAECWAYLRALQSGHPGGVTTAHAMPGVPAAMAALMLMIRENPSAASASEHLITKLLRTSINVVAHAVKVSGDAVPYRLTHLEEIEA